MVWDVSREMILFGTVPLRWYSLLFAFGIVTGYFLMISMYKAEGKPPGMVDALLIYVVIGTVVGARLGHCLFYEPREYLHDPIRILKVWEGGLASHGGYAGVIAAMWLYTRRRPEIGFLWLADRIAPTALFAGAMIRIGNLFNSEILGRPTDVPWAVVFKRVDDLPRHPTQIYEAITYAVISVAVYAYYLAKKREPRPGRLLGAILLFGMTSRIVIETFKEVQVDFEQSLPLDMGQILSIPFALLGLALLLGLHEKLAGYLAQQALVKSAAGDGPSDGGGAAVDAKTVIAKRKKRRR